MKNLNYLITMIVMLFTINSFCQSGWQSGNYYYERGSSEIICGNAYSVYRTNGINYWYEWWKDCQQRMWHQQYYSGYIYLWGSQGWYTQWQEGYFWYFTWRNFSTRIS
ncbi:hypothetical protein [Flavobacterium sp. MK4S-17]|uniref:hypothetical protein n=1 Tax=Flavobacterium sp. MK4S-17 TaxID=2543737 RepID=UPI00135C32DE|nr:hypothetical protein [Flavobacterium sp. MK4S-17]